jgi:hypothetical protein
MHRVRARTIAFLSLISFCIIGAGCTTLHTLPRPRSGTDMQSAGLQRGDKVYLKLRTGESRTLRVTTLENDVLVSGKTRIAFAEIEKIQRPQFSARRTLGLAGGVVAAASGLWFATVIKNGRDSE